MDQRHPKWEVQPRGGAVEPDMLPFIPHRRGLRHVERADPLPLVGLPVDDLRHPMYPTCAVGHRFMFYAEAAAEVAPGSRQTRRGRANWVSGGGSKMRH